MVLPPWLVFVVAGLVIVFGGYRIRIALMSKESIRTRRGLYALPRRTNLLIGVLYIVLGGFLVASGLGVIKSPFQ